MSKEYEKNMSEPKQDNISRIVIKGYKSIKATYRITTRYNNYSEPELGLHPYAITIFTELVKKAAAKKQVIISTQSAELLDYFEPEDVIVVDRGENGSEFKRLDAQQLAAWLEDDYSLGELWNKNLFGGKVFNENLG